MEEMGTPWTSERGEMEELEAHVSIAKDAVDIWQNMQHHDKQLSLKRKFLMGLSSSVCSKQSVRLNAGEKSVLPESFLRKDDLFYEDAKDYVERCFGAFIGETEQHMTHEDLKVSDLHNISRTILTLLDDLSNNALYNLAKALTTGLVTSVKTRPKMKRFVKTKLLALQNDQFIFENQVKFKKEISQLLKNPKNFRQNYGNRVKLIQKSHRDDVMKVLNGLDCLRGHTLKAMCRKLDGIQRYRPQLSCRPSVSHKRLLVNKVRKLCLEMINQLGESDELQEPLAKAMAVACLSLKLGSHSQGFSVPKFLQVTPEVETLQNEIVRAIKLLDLRFRKEDMKELLQLLDPDFEAKGKSLRTAIRNLLRDFLFECIDMDAVPDSLLGILSLIRKRAPGRHRSLLKDLIEDDVECILNVGAHLKQILWDCDIGGQADLDFVNAYMEELEESDDGDFLDDDDDAQMLNTTSLNECRIRLDDFSEEVGSTGESYDDSFSSPPAGCESSLKSTTEFATAKVFDDVCSDSEIGKSGVFEFSATKGGSSPLVSPGLAGVSVAMGSLASFKNSSMGSIDPDGNCFEQKPMCRYQDNRYVALQEVCDNASLAAYQLIGHVLDEFGRIEASGLDCNEKSYLRGDNSRPECFEDPLNSTDKDLRGSIIVEAVRKVIPSFSERQLDIVKKFLSS